jgi:hypothetical protein
MSLGYQSIILEFFLAGLTLRSNFYIGGLDIS